MANNIKISDYDFTNLQNYPNVGFNKDNELVEFSFDGNISIRPDNVKLILTPEAQEEWNKCSKDLFYFIENYCYIQTQDYGKIKVVLRDFQVEFLKMIIEESRIIGMLARQVGKCVEKKSLIKVRNKRTGIIEDITIEDFHLRVKNK